MFEIWQLILIGLIFSTAAMVHGLCGFGFSMLAVGIMSIFIEPKIAIPLDLVVASSNCFYLMWRLRKSIMLRETVVLLILSTIAIPFGALYLRNINSGIVIRSLGAVIIIISAIAVFKKSKLKMFSSGIFKFFAGILSGLLGGAFNVPGPPLVLYSYNCHWPIRNAMANLQLIFSVTTVMAFISYLWMDLLTTQIIITGIGYMPLVVLFTALSSFLSQKLKTAHLKVIINFALLALGLCLLFKG